MSTKDKLIQMMRESTLVQGGIALTVTITICAMYLLGKTVPTELFGVLGMILGFYYGTKSQYLVTKQADEIARIKMESK